VKIYWIMFLSCLILFACSSTSVDPVESATSEIMKKAELNPLEKVSKVCIESNIDECYSAFVENNLARDYPEETGILNNYIHLYNGLKSDQSIEAKIDIIKTKMSFLQNRNYTSAIESNKEVGNEYYARFLEENIVPLDTFYDKKSVSIGMNTLQLIISMGYPDKINKTTNSYGTSAQWVYRDYDMYVYLDDGIVTSYQD
jgi:hypothetical protein